MPATVSEKRAAFRALHQSGCFALPNPWDAGSAKYLQSLGFKALASTSAGFAWSIGKSDNRVTREDVLSHLEMLCAATDLPVNADFEGGFADDPEGVAASVRLAVATPGVAGLSIEDRTTDKAAPLYEDALAVDRIAAARAAIDEGNSGVMLVARCEGLLVGVSDLDLIIRRMVAFAEAGADCLYAPGLGTPEQISAPGVGGGAQAGQCPVGLWPADRERHGLPRCSPRQHRRLAGARGLGRLCAGGEERSCWPTREL